MKKLFISLLTCTLLLTSVAHARSTIPITNLENEAIAAASGKVLTLDDVAKALRQAAVVRGWSVEDTGPGKAVATLDVRGKHTIKVDIDYTEKAMSFKYKDSVNMKYGRNDESQAVIHPFYIKWVRNLLSDVRAELGRF